MLTVISFRGRPGVGKTTLSAALAHSLRCVRISKDDIYDNIFPHIPRHEDRNNACFTALSSILSSNTDNDTTMILDHPMQSEKDINSLHKLSQECGFQLISILVICSDKELWRKRLAQRAINPMPNQMITDLDKFEERYGTLELKPLKDEVVVDSIHSKEKLLAQIQLHLSTTM